MDCVFCKIVSKDLKSDIIYEDGDVIAFKDLNPVAPVHFLVIPKAHIESANDLNSGNSGVISKIFSLIPELAKKMNIMDGYRIVNNCGSDACQTVWHIHFHVIGGRKLNWPAG